MNIEEIIKEIDFLSGEIGYIGIDSIKDAHSAQQALDILKNRIEQNLPIHNVVRRSEQYFCCKDQIGQRCSEQCLGCFQFENTKQ